MNTTQTNFALTIVCAQLNRERVGSVGRFFCSAEARGLRLASVYMMKEKPEKKDVDEAIRYACSKKLKTEQEKCVRAFMNGSDVYQLDMVYPCVLLYCLAFLIICKVLVPVNLLLSSVWSLCRLINTID